jgi:chitodextrinase
MSLSGGFVLTGAPSAPIIGTATSTGPTAAEVTFTQPVYDGGSVITSYTAVSNPGNITGTLSQSGSGTITVSGLTVGTPYTFTVYATNTNGNSESSAASNTITGNPTGTPDAPIIGTATPTSDVAATVTYTAPPQTYSLSFAGTLGSYLSASSSVSKFAMGVDPFCIELWFYALSGQNSFPILVCNGNYQTNRWQICFNHQSYPNKIAVNIFNVKGNGSGGDIVSGVLTYNAWHHVALVRSASSAAIYLFIDGINTGSAISQVSLDGGVNPSGIIIGQDSGQAGTPFKGYISNLRIVKNNGVYPISGNITVPTTTLNATQLNQGGTGGGAITGTQTSLLTAQSRTQIDNSTFGAALTLAGNASITSSFIPTLTGITGYTATATPGNITGTLSQSGSGTITVSGLSPATNYTFTVYATNAQGNGPISGASNQITTPVNPGQQAYTSPGTYSWICPAGVTSISVVAVGAGGYRGSTGTNSPVTSRCGGGGGGALAYKNNITVVPGTSYTVIVGGTVNGSAGGNSEFTWDTGTMIAGGGGGGNFTTQNPGPGVGGTRSGTYDGGGVGGTGGAVSVTAAGVGGGGGAGGYSGAGGAGGAVDSSSVAIAGSTGTGGSGGGGSGRSGGTSAFPRIGGGVGIFGQGGSGAGGAVGANGSPGSSGVLALYGGGGSGFLGGPSYGGGDGAVRIIWPGTARQFPSTRTANE